MASVGEANGKRSGFVEESRVNFLFKKREEVFRGFFQIGEALKTETKVAQRLGDVWRIDSCESQAGEERIQNVPIDKVSMPASIALRAGKWGPSSVDAGRRDSSMMSLPYSSALTCSTRWEMRFQSMVDFSSM